MIRQTRAVLLLVTFVPGTAALSAALPNVAVPNAAFLTAVQADALADLAWLEGEWHRQTRNGSAIERWRRTDAGLVGEALVQRGDQSMQTEALLLAAMGGEIFYIAKPRENPYPVAFRLVSREGGAFVFENPEHDFPQRIIYTRTSDTAMTASIEGPGEGGAPQRIDFVFTRR
jgi:hypothetical protein